MTNEVCPIWGEAPEAFPVVVVLRVVDDYVLWVHQACRAAVYRTLGAPKPPVRT